MKKDLSIPFCGVEENANIFTITINLYYTINALCDSNKAGLEQELLKAIREINNEQIARSSGNIGFCGSDFNCDTIIIDINCINDVGNPGQGVKDAAQVTIKLNKVPLSIDGGPVVETIRTDLIYHRRYLNFPVSFKNQYLSIAV